MAGSIAGAVLLGWIFHIEVLTNMRPGLPTVKFNTAVGIGLLASSWWIPRRIALLGTILVGGLAGTTLTEYVLVLNLGIDNVLVQDKGLSAHPGRPSVVTACCLLLLAWAVGANLVGGRRLVQAAATAVLCLSTFTLVGRLYGVPQAYSVGPYSTLSLPTTAGLILLSVAVLLSVPRGKLWWMLAGHDAGARTLRALLPWTLVVLPLLGYLQLLGQRLGWYGTYFGLTITVGTSALVLTIVVWNAASTVAVMDREKAAAIDALQALTDDLEQRVLARTVELEQERVFLRAAESAARVAQADAEQANAVKDEFLSRASHELRTPLTAVLGFAQLLEMEPMTPSQEEAVSHILRAGRHLLVMINDLLNARGIESDRLGLHPEPVDLPALLAESLALIQPLADAHRVEVRFDPGDPDATPDVRADRRKLREVLLNLMSNAVKYNRPNGLIDITVQLRGHAHLGVSIADTGIGISGSDLTNLFTPFDRLGQQFSGIEGTGLGLAVSQRLTTLMGGRLEVDSTPGIGSTFSVIMPLNELAPKSVTGAIPQVRPHGGRVGFPP